MAIGSYKFEQAIEVAIILMEVVQAAKAE